MTNEQLVERIQAGEREWLLELWQQVRQLVGKYARRWAAGGRNGVETEDLVQTGFIAVLRAADTFDASAVCAFTTWLGIYLKQEFTQATGQRTKRDRMDPLQTAKSLDIPLTDEWDSDPLSALIPDPAAEAAMQSVEERDWAEHRRAAVEAAIATLSEEQQSAIRKRYYEVQLLCPGQTRYQDSKVYAAALKLLRHPSRSRALMEYARG